MPGYRLRERYCMSPFPSRTFSATAAPKRELHHLRDLFRDNAMPGSRLCE
jgi:hypothetical protein